MSLREYQFIESDIAELLQKVEIDKLYKLKKSSLCLTGASGFLGTWILEIINYLNLKHDFKTEVFCFDRDTDKLKSNAPHLYENFKENIKCCDVRYLVELPKQINYLIHCAATPDNRVHATNPVDVLSTCSLGTENVLRATDRLSDFRMFVNMSSSLVYGNFNNLNRAVKESDTLENLVDLSAYVSGKNYSEALTSSYRQQYRTPSVIIRPFTFIGPYQSLSSPWALNNFINDAISGSTIKVLGTGKTVRSFLYGADAAFWTLFMALNGESGSIYNLGSSEPIDLSAAAKMVVSNFTEPKEIIFCGSSNEKQNYMVPDTNKIEKQFGFKANFSTEKAISRSIAWYKMSK